MLRPDAVLPPAPRRRWVRWALLLTLGYLAAGALLVRDYVVQSRTATREWVARPDKVPGSALSTSR
ncbi:MAG TPA: hypothetical protein VLT82_16885 [Myxococcaceae bacterium]|nr:hypothetical protein [Myxococcaceae bacterium]